MSRGKTISSYSGIEYESAKPPFDIASPELIEGPAVSPVELLNPGPFDKVRDEVCSAEY